MKPYRVRLLMADRLAFIEGEYRKVFGEELMRDIG
jgi:tetrahydromethanopterin S-methyltransferase subunit G